MLAPSPGKPAGVYIIQNTMMEGGGEKWPLAKNKKSRFTGKNENGEENEVKCLWVIPKLKKISREEKGGVVWEKDQNAQFIPL